MSWLQFWRLASGDYNSQSSFFTKTVFPAPDASGIMTSGAVGKANRAVQVDDWYTERLTGFFVPPYNATYTFYLGGDDRSDLSLSTDANASNLAVIAGISSYNEWGFPFFRQAAQVAAPRNLTGGKPYYFRIRHAEGNGQDWVRGAVRITNAPAAGIANYSVCGNA